jgi:CheY-like chemotaxis protein
MPDVSGHQVVRRAHELRPGAPVVLTTGWGETIGPEQLQEMHVTALLAKPFTHEDLRIAMDQVHAALNAA